MHTRDPCMLTIYVLLLAILWLCRDAVWLL